MPTRCSIGLLGGNGSDARQQASAKCAGLCPAGTFCAEEATVQPSLCPKGRYCPQGTATPLPCEAGTFGDAAGLSGADQCTPTTAQDPTPRRAAPSRRRAAAAPRHPAQVWKRATSASQASIRTRQGSRAASSVAAEATRPTCSPASSATSASTALHSQSWAFPVRSAPPPKAAAPRALTSAAAARGPTTAPQPGRSAAASRAT